MPSDLPRTGDLAMTVGGALALPPTAEPWALNAAMSCARPRRVTREVAARSRYLGWMCLWGGEVMAVFLDPITMTRLAQYAPGDDEVERCRTR